MGAETIHLRGEGGGVFAFDLPLPEGVQCRVDRQELVRVNADGTPWVEPVEPEKPLTPKEQLQADASALGLGTDGKADEIKARIEAHVVDLRKQGTDLDIADADTLDPVELSKAIDAKLAAAPPVPPAQ